MAVRLAFGTAGIRARLGDGDDELNLRTVRVVGQALCEYVASVDGAAKEHGICVGYDGRTLSREFALELTDVALALGFLVRTFETVVATPLLAHATQHHGAALGLMVTASHNPPSDNGIKVYWQGGAQIMSPHDRAIAARIEQISELSGPPRAHLASARASGRLVPLGEEDQRAYLEAVGQLLAARATSSARPLASTLPIVVYSALCGVGTPLARALSERSGVKLLEVASQAWPRTDFGGLSSPNPEHASALEELMRLGTEANAAFGFCHDPDADRVAVVAREADGVLRALSGDEVGALLVDFLLSQEPEPQPRSAVVSTLVSGTLVERIAAAHGAHFERTLTGFKWITARGRALEREAGLRYLFGYEEALGYCFGALGDDKDGLAAMFVLLRLARELGASGRSFCGRLEELAREHGLFVSRQLTVSASGPEGMAHVQSILRALRSRAPSDWLDPSSTREDFLLQAARANLLVFRVGERARVCVRPSGTEPKLKFYLEASERVAQAEPLADARARAESTLGWLEARVRGVTG